MDLSIIIVNYNGRELLERCLASVERQNRGLSTETIVIDNGSTDGSQAMLKERFAGVEQILNPENKGFAAANNQGIRQARGELLLLLNSDTELNDDALARVVQFARSRRSPGITGCRLTFGDGSPQSSVRSFPSLWNLWCEALFLTEIFPQSRLFGRYNMKYFDYSRPSAVDWVSGAFFLIDREVLGVVGLLDEQFFMYSEEMDYCLRAKEHGFETWYTPAASVIHHWLSVDTVSVRGIAWLLQSQIFFFQKHYPGLEGRLMVLVRYFGLVLRLFVYPIVAILTLKKGLFHHWNCLRIALLKVLAAGRSYRPDRSADPWTDLL